MRVDDRWLEISTSLATLVSLMNKLKVDENALRVDERWLENSNASLWTNSQKNLNQFKVDAMCMRVDDRWLEISKNESSHSRQFS